MVENNPNYLKRLEKEDELQNDNLRKKNKNTSKTFYNGENIINYLGLCLFLFIFTFLISNVMHDHGYYAFLLGYLPNQDLVATVLTRWGGPFGIWSELYPEDQSNLHTWASVNVINYISLLGLTYIVAKEVHEHNSIHLGWSMAFVMCLMTYLLPSPLITYSMNLVYERFSNNNILAVLAGAITTVLIILLESFILDQYRSQLVKISKTVIKLGHIF